MAIEIPREVPIPSAPPPPVRPDAPRAVDVMPKLGEMLKAIAFARAHYDEHERGQATDAERASVLLAYTLFGMAGMWLERKDASETHRKHLDNVLDVFAAFIMHEGV